MSRIEDKHIEILSIDSDPKEIFKATVASIKRGELDRIGVTSIVSLYTRNITKCPNKTKLGGAFRFKVYNN